MRVGYLGPEGTFSEEALRAALPGSSEYELVGLPSVFDVVAAVQIGGVERALVPIENSLEGAVNATLDALAGEADDVTIVGEVVHPIRVCLIARSPLALEAIELVVSHPQPSAQCARFLRAELPRARVLSAASTADAVRALAEGGTAQAALGTRSAAELYGCEVLRADVEDDPGNETRFVWLARQGDTPSPGPGPWKTSIVFWGPGAEAPGWLVRCLSELAFRGVNLTRIESRPRQGLGRYMFFVDLEGRDSEAPVAAALAAIEAQVARLRVLGSYPAA